MMSRSDLQVNEQVQRNLNVWEGFSVYFTGFSSEVVSSSFLKSVLENSRMENGFFPGTSWELVNHAVKTRLEFRSYVKAT